MEDRNHARIVLIVVAGIGALAVLDLLLVGLLLVTNKDVPDQLYNTLLTLIGALVGLLVNTRSGPTPVVQAETPVQVTEVPNTQGESWPADGTSSTTPSGPA